MSNNNCEHENLRQIVKVYYDAPARWHNFTKSGIRRREVERLGRCVDVSLYCRDCGQMFTRDGKVYDADDAIFTPPTPDQVFSERQLLEWYEAYTKKAAVSDFGIQTSNHKRDTNGAHSADLTG